MISIFRWIEDKPVADRLIEIWSCSVKLVEFRGKLPKSKCPACKSYCPIVEAVQEPLAVSLQVNYSLFLLLIKLTTQ